MAYNDIRRNLRWSTSGNRCVKTRRQVDALSTCRTQGRSSSKHPARDSYTPEKEARDATRYFAAQLRVLRAREVRASPGGTSTSGRHDSVGTLTFRCRPLRRRRVLANFCSANPKKAGVCVEVRPIDEVCTNETHLSEHALRGSFVGVNDAGNHARLDPKINQRHHAILGFQRDLRFALQRIAPSRHATICPQISLLLILTLHDSCNLGPIRSFSTPSTARRCSAGIACRYICRVTSDDAWPNNACTVPSGAPTASSNVA
jgi:hypothetical protein